MLSEDVVAFLRSRPIAMMCTRDANNRPSSHETFLADVEADRIVVLVPEHLARNLVENVRDNGAAALLVSRAPGDHRSVQMKGRITEIDPAAPRQDLFGATGVLVAMFRTFMPEEKAARVWERMIQQPVHRMRFEIAQVFDQTPGPGAGQPLPGGAA